MVVFSPLDTLTSFATTPESPNDITATMASMDPQHRYWEVKEWVPGIPSDMTAHFMLLVDDHPFTLYLGAVCPSLHHIEATR